MFGTRHEASPEVLTAILQAIGDSGNDSAVPPTIVLRDRDSFELPADVLSATIRWEQGGETVLPGPAPVLPPDLPWGYHSLDYRTATGAATTHLIVVPPSMWSPRNGRCAGVAISLYGLRSDRNWGCGDLRDLTAFLDWAAHDLGAEFVALNPLHAIHNRQPYNTSPYLPLSTYFRNFLYLDIEAIEEFQHPSMQAMFHSPAEAAERAALREAEFVEYERVAAIKLRFLRAVFEAYRQSPDGGFEEYRAQGGELLKTFALYCALDEHIRESVPGTWLWTEWPVEYRHPASPACRAFADDHAEAIRFHQWLQWQLSRQLLAVQRHALDAGMSIGLYHDLALATDRFGCDLWSNPEHFVSGCRVGSPPDGFSPEGQDWSFPPPNTAAHLEDGYRLFVASIRQNAAHGGALRMDHVMRLFRLFWIPEGHTAKEGTYVHERWRDLLGILALESHRQRIRIIGEDLGTITDGMREGLREYGVLGYRLLFFERNGDGSFRRPEDYSESAVATVTTHDLPTLAGFWANRDIEARMAAGLLPEEAVYRKQLSDRVGEKQGLLDLLHQLDLLPEHFPRDASTVPELTGELHYAIVGLLASTPCELFVINQEDLTKETEQQNLPGSTWQYPNWRRKMRYRIEDLTADSVVRDYSAMLRSWLEKSGRVRRKS